MSSPPSTGPLWQALLLRWLAFAGMFLASLLAFPMGSIVVASLSQGWLPLLPFDLPVGLGLLWPAMALAPESLSRENEVVVSGQAFSLLAVPAWGLLGLAVAWAFRRPALQWLMLCSWPIILLAWGCVEACFALSGLHQTLTTW